MTPRCLGGSHLDEEARNVQGRTVMSDLKRNIKTLDILVVPGAFQEHFPPRRQTC